MKLKGKRNVTLERDASPIRPNAEDTSANHEPTQEEIRRRAYEIYLERNGLPGDELDDWLRARSSTIPTPRTEIDMQRMGAMGRKNQW